VITPQGAADISSRTKGLEVNADGSVDLYFGPKEAYFDKSWQLNDIELVK